MDKNNTRYRCDMLYDVYLSFLDIIQYHRFRTVDIVNWLGYDSNKSKATYTTRCMKLLGPLLSSCIYLSIIQSNINVLFVQ